MNQNNDTLNEKRLSLHLGNALQKLPELSSSLKFDELHLSEKNSSWFKPAALAASVLLTGLLSLNFYKPVPLEHGLAETDLLVLIKNSQELEQDLSVLNHEYQLVKDDLKLFKVFNEISLIDEKLAQNYTSNKTLSTEQLSRYWKLRIEKLNFAIEIVNSNIKPVFI